LPVGVKMPDGRVLVVGGDAGLSLPGREADMFDPVTGKWRPVGPMAEPREYFAAANLPNGKTMVIGGFSIKGEMFVSLASTEIFNARTLTFKPGKPMKHERTEFSVTTLPNGGVMPWAATPI